MLTRNKSNACPPLKGLLVCLALGLCAYAPAQEFPTLADKPVTISAEVTSYGLVSFRAGVNNSQPIWFALDSGASFAFVIDNRRATNLRLKLQGNFTRQGGAGPDAYTVALTRGISIDLPGLTFRDQTAGVLALGSLEPLAGRNLDGLFGSELFTRYVIEIDYAEQKVILRDSRTYKYSGTGKSLPLTARDKYLFIRATIEMPDRKRLDGEFLVDTGGAFITAVLTVPFAQSHNLPARSQKSVFDGSLSGLGGQTKVLATRAKSFTVGGVAIDQPVIYISQDRGGALANSDFDGIIGGEILRKFKVIFDLSRGRLILEPNTYFNEPVDYDASGLRLRAYGDDFRIFRVSQVLERSPAAEAGLHEGDTLTNIDGRAAPTFTLDQIYQMLKQPGREFSLGFTRGGRTFSAKIKTRKLI